MTSRTIPTRRQAILVCAFAAFTALVCGGLLLAAALIPAPPAVLPLVVAVCIPAPMLAAWDLRPSVGVLRARRADRDRLLAEMRSYLAQLPETDHPLD